MIREHATWWRRLQDRCWIYRTAAPLFLLWMPGTGAHASVALLTEEPFGTFGAMNPTGHATIYLNHVCAQSWIAIRTSMQCRARQISPLWWIRLRLRRCATRTVENIWRSVWRGSQVCVGAWCGRRCGTQFLRSARRQKYLPKSASDSGILNWPSMAV